MSKGGSCGNGGGAGGGNEGGAGGGNGGGAEEIEPLRAFVARNRNQIKKKDEDRYIFYFPSE